MRTRKGTLRSTNPSHGTLADESRESVGQLLGRSNKRSSKGTKKNEDISQLCDSTSMPASGSETKDDRVVDSRTNSFAPEAEDCSREASHNLMEDKVGRDGFDGRITINQEDMSDSDWEDGSIPVLDSAENRKMTIEFNQTPELEKRKPVRRATAEEKELSETIHKVHLLCLLGRGRLIDTACDDPLIQAALLSLLPKHLLNISKVAKLTTKDLHPLHCWFLDNFHVKSPSHANMSFRSALTIAIETREGSSEEIAALSVALFRALSLTTRFVSILDVTSLKPDGDKSRCFTPDENGSLFSTSIPMVTRQSDAYISPSRGKSSFPNERDIACETSRRSLSWSKDSISTPEKGSSGDASELKDNQPCSLPSAVNQDTQACQGKKRKGDIEFELQMAMALSTTAVGTMRTGDSEMGKSIPNNSNSNMPNTLTPLKRAKRILSEETSSSHGVSTAIGSKRLGSPLYWAEVYCSGENLMGKWVHVDAVNGVIDGEQKVEAVAAACRVSLRYVIAFAGNGAKDVTRRYCMKWYKIASKRVNQTWWDAVLAPMRELESRATSDMFNLNSDTRNEQNISNTSTLVESSSHESKVSFSENDKESFSSRSLTTARSSIEDMEFETRALTEPLPTNQQAYRTHQLYAIEKWLNKNQILHPKGPILGFFAGHAVYPRTCVQTLKTKERWLRDALQVKQGELPVKEIHRPGKLQNVKSLEDDDYAVENCEGTLKLYGRWQLEPIELPHAVNGKVPKNERGQVEVWSEKCLPHGTVHLRLPRVFAVAKRLEIDYASAMVGFEYRNGQSYPVFEGIVVCSEFKDVILEAYVAEQEQREAVEKKKIETQAISRWYQLLSSIVTRQRLKNRYGEGSSASLASATNQSSSSVRVSAVHDDKKHSRETQLGNKCNNELRAPSGDLDGEHQHDFVTVDECFDEEDNLVLIKRCDCGFSLLVEDL